MSALPIAIEQFKIRAVDQRRLLVGLR